MTSSNWVKLLDEPKAITGPYGGSVPSLSSFAPHAWRAHFDHVAVAGQFLSLPANVPPSWGTPGNARADVVFEFYDVRSLQVEGVLERGNDDDTLHGNPCGVSGIGSLIEMPEAYLKNALGEVLQHWKRFEFTQASFSIRIEAGNVAIYSGRRASGHFGSRHAV